MIELRITGGDLKEFYANTAQAFLLLAQGGNNVFAKPAETVEQPQTTGAIQEAVAEPNPPVDVKPKRTRSTKAPVTIEAVAEPVPEIPAKAVDEDPLGLNDVAQTETPTEYTLDDMRQRVKDILAMHGPKDAKDAPKGARGNDMAACVAYVRKLFAPFNVKLAADLKPAQFAEFMTASQPYLDGTAEA